MSTLRLIVSEIRFRFVNFVLSLAAVVVAAMLFVTGPTLIAGYAADTNQQLTALQAEADELQAQTERLKAETETLLADMDRQTRITMRDLGVNLRIVHKDTNMGDLYSDFAAVDFPEEYVQRLAKSEQIETIVHVVATLQHKIKWNQRTALLVGILPISTVAQQAESKGHMVKNVARGTVLVGHELGAGRTEGEVLEIEGHPFKVAKIMPEYGERQDIQLVVHLADAQEILKRPGQINQILALNCKCKGDRISVIRRELERVLPDTKVTEQSTIATAREQQRDVVEKARRQQVEQMEKNVAHVLANREAQAEHRRRQEGMLARLVSITTPVVVLAAALFVGLMAWLNVRERQAEIGVLRALGKGVVRIAGLFLGKAALVGVVGGVLGAAAGYCLAPLLGFAAMGVSGGLCAVAPWLLLATALGAPVVTATASYLPTLAAIAQDPAVVLMDR